MRERTRRIEAIREKKRNLKERERRWNEAMR